MGPASRRRKLALLDTVVYPIEPHVHGFGLLLAEFLSCDTYRSGIVDLDGCGSLWTTHLRKGGADGYHCLDVAEDGDIL